MSDFRRTKTMNLEPGTDGWGTLAGSNRLFKTPCTGKIGKIRHFGVVPTMPVSPLTPLDNRAP